MFTIKKGRNMKNRYQVALCLFMLLATATTYAKNIKMILIYTPSHYVLRDQWFLPTLQDDFELEHHDLSQVCKSASFMEAGWLDLMHQRLDILIKAISENMGDIIVYSDVDIQFFRPFKDLIYPMMENKDILVQRNRPIGSVCAGFYFCRCNEKTLKLHHNIKQYMLTHPGSNDQDGMDYLLRINNVDDISWALLPDEFYNPGMRTGKRWSPGDQLTIPNTIILHHACWTVGIENKIKQFEYIKSLISAQK